MGFRWERQKPMGFGIINGETTMVSTFSGKHKLGVLKKTTSVLKLDFHKIS
jgi:hypothetical protein